MKWKKCFKCGEIKELDMFYTHREMADGHINKCIECTKKDVLAYRGGNIDKIRIKDRERAKLPRRRHFSRLNVKRWEEANPLAHAAHLLLKRAVKTKVILKPTKCSLCGAESCLHGHHDDYLKPLEVEWLCAVCHSKYRLSF